MKTCLALLLAIEGAATAAEFHVATSGSDANPGTAAQPLLTIQAAADRAQPGEHGKPGPVGTKTGIGRDSGDPAYQGYIAAEFTYPILPKGGARQGGADWFHSLPKL